MEKSFSIIIKSKEEYLEAKTYLELQGLKVNNEWCDMIINTHSMNNKPLFLNLVEEWCDNEFELYQVNYTDTAYTLNKYIADNPLPMSVYDMDSINPEDLVVSQIPGERIIIFVSKVDKELISGTVIFTNSPSHPIGSFLPRISKQNIRKYYGEIKLKSKILKDV